MKQVSEIKQAEALFRQQRIDCLGSFGMKKEQVVKDKTQYTRKIKHKNALT